VVRGRPRWNGSRIAGGRVFRYGRLLMALPRAQIHRMRCDHLSPTTPRPPSPILRSPPPAKPLASTWALSSLSPTAPAVRGVRARPMNGLYSTCEISAFWAWAVERGALRPGYNRRREKGKKIVHLTSSNFPQKKKNPPPTFARNSILLQSSTS
jgi:hypothetical protein